MDQAAGAVGELRVPAHGTPMGEIAQHGEALLHDGVRFFALDMRDETHTAGVMFVRGVVQTLGFRAMRLNHGESGRMCCGGEITPFYAFRGPALDYTCVSFLFQLLRATLLSSNLPLRLPKTIPNLPGPQPPPSRPATHPVHSLPPSVP